MGVLYLDNNNYFIASFSHTLPILSLRNIIFPLFAELLSCCRYHHYNNYLFIYSRIK